MEFFTALLGGLAVMTVIAALLATTVIVFELHNNRGRNRLQDQYLELVQKYGFRSKAEGLACIASARKGDYRSAIDLLLFEREDELGPTDYAETL